MQKSLRKHTEKEGEMRRLLLDISDAVGAGFSELLKRIGIAPERWNEITTNGHINLTEASMLSKAIGVELDYFIYCFVHMGQVASRFNNKSYDCTQTRSKFTRKILELNSKAISTHNSVKQN